MAHLHHAVRAIVIDMSKLKLQYQELVAMATLLFRSHNRDLIIL